MLTVMDYCHLVLAMLLLGFQIFVSKKKKKREKKRPLNPLHKRQVFCFVSRLMDFRGFKSHLDV